MAIGTHLPGGTASAFKASSCLLLALRAGVVQPGRLSQTMQAFSSSAPPFKDPCTGRMLRNNRKSDFQSEPSIGCPRGARDLRGRRVILSRFSHRGTEFWILANRTSWSIPTALHIVMFGPIVSLNDPACRVSAGLSALLKPSFEASPTTSLYGVAHHWPG